MKNSLIGVNFIDTYHRNGLYPLTSFPAIIGQEAAGSIASLGPGPNPFSFKTGDRVVWMKSGAYAEYTAVPTDKIVKIPNDISDRDAIGGFLMGLTALSLIREASTVKSGDWVLLHAAAGGVGLLMCQLLRAAGARVIGTAGGKQKGQLAKDNGAEEVLDYKDPEAPAWVDEVRRITAGKGVRVVYDSVGKDTWEGSLEVVKRKGTVVFYGNASGPVPPFPITRLTAKNVTLLRPTVMGYTATREEFTGYADEFFRMVREGLLKIRVHKEYQLRDAQKAHEDLESRKTTGKLLLVP